MTRHRGSAAAVYVPVEARPWRLSMGLRPLDVARWLEVDARRDAELAEKRRLLGDPATHARVVAALPGSEAASDELLAAVVDNLADYHPRSVVRGGDGTIIDRASGHVVDPSVLHPVDAAGRLVQEDLCVMERRGTSWMLAAASVCFPSRWSLPSKIGADISTIHAPVPGYEEVLRRPTEGFFDRLRVERPVWRLNWTLIDRPALHQPDPGDRRRPARLVDPGRELWFRVERQTLRRLSERPAVVFTIRTYVTVLEDLVAAHPEAGDALAAVLPTVPAATVAYKGWEGVTAPLLAWLAARAGPGPAS